MATMVQRDLLHAAHAEVVTPITTHPLVVRLRSLNAQTLNPKP